MLGLLLDSWNGDEYLNPPKEPKMEDFGKGELITKYCVCTHNIPYSPSPPPHKAFFILEKTTTFINFSKNEQKSNFQPAAPELAI